MPRKGDMTFEELCRRVPLDSLVHHSDEELLDMATRLANERLNIAVQAGAALAALRTRGYSITGLQHETGLHRKTVTRWTKPILDRMHTEDESP